MKTSRLCLNSCRVELSELETHHWLQLDPFAALKFKKKNETEFSFSIRYVVLTVV